MSIGKKDFDFEKDAETVNQIAGTENRLLFWKRRLKEYIQTDFSDLGWNDFDTKVKAEIEYLEYELSVKTEQKELYENTFTKSERESLNDTFDKIRYGWLSELEQINFIEEITDNYNLEKLKALEHDVGFYIFMEKEDRLAQITEEERQKKFNEYWEQGKRLPTNKPPIEFNSTKKNLSKFDRWELNKWDSDKTVMEYHSPPKKMIEPLTMFGAFRFRISQSRIINMERIFFPFEFWLITKFKSMVQTKIMQVGSDGKGWLRKTKLQDLQSNKNSSYPNHKEVAEQYHIEKGSKHKEYSADQIAPVMEVTQTYIEENPGLSTIHGHVKPIIDKCNGLTGGRDAKSNWIKFYAEKAGLKSK